MQPNRWKQKYASVATPPWKPTLNIESARWNCVISQPKVMSKAPTEANISQRFQAMPSLKVEWGSRHSCCRVNILRWKDPCTDVPLSVCERWHHCTFVGLISLINWRLTHGTDTWSTCWPLDMPQPENQDTVSPFVDFHTQKRGKLGLAAALGGPKHKEAGCMLRSVNFNKLAQAWWVRLQADEARFLSDMTQAMALEPGSETEGKASYAPSNWETHDPNNNGCKISNRLWMEMV